MKEKMDANHATVIVQVVAPEGLMCDLDSVSVELNHTQLPVSYTALTDASGKARFDVEYGFYRAKASFKYTNEMREGVLNASSSMIVVNNNREKYIEMEAAYPRNEQLVFSEIYYSCCKGADGKNYLKDQYLKICNNSPEVAYLDSICIGFLDPMNASQSLKGWEGLPYLPIINFMWMFPGTGKDLPLQPGQEIVVGVNAINHIALGNTQSVDLSKDGYWAMYDEKANLTQQSPPAPGVKCMLNVWKYRGSSSLSSTNSPAWIMWKLPDMSMEHFLNNYIMNHPTNTTSTSLYVTVPVEWVYDGVECFERPGYVKRLPASIDNGHTSLNASIGSGLAVHRKVDEKLSGPERIVYMDTNNSSEDFIVKKPSLKE
ncbi:MAG: DUF4876 domain-containing protein [Bacteroidales bacterium]